MMMVMRTLIMMVRKIQSQSQQLSSDSSLLASKNGTFSPSTFLEGPLNFVCLSLFEMQHFLLTIVHDCCCGKLDDVIEDQKLHLLEMESRKEQVRFLICHNFWLTSLTKFFMFEIWRLYYITCQSLQRVSSAIASALL